MAKATRNPARYERVEVAPETFTLELSKEEAQVLRFIAGGVTGDWEKSPRKHTRAVFKALTEAGVPHRGYVISPGTWGALFFFEDTED